MLDYFSDEKYPESQALICLNWKNENPFPILKRIIFFDFGKNKLCKSEDEGNSVELSLLVENTRD